MTARSDRAVMSMHPQGPCQEVRQNSFFPAGRSKPPVSVAAAALDS